MDNNGNFGLNVSKLVSASYLKLILFNSVIKLFRRDNLLEIDLFPTEQKKISKMLITFSQ